MGLAGATVIPLLTLCLELPSNWVGLCTPVLAATSQHPQGLGELGVAASYTHSRPLQLPGPVGVSAVRPAPGDLVWA